MLVKARIRKQRKSMDWIEYYKIQAQRADDEIYDRANVKKMELAKALAGFQIGLSYAPVKIAVLGCGDRRMVQLHRDIFREILSREVKIFTFDINIAHLEGEDNVIKHDCVRPLPKGPYDIVYSQVLLKFLRPEDQWKVIWNSYKALAIGGRAVHILNRGDYTDTGEARDEDDYLVLLDEWKERLYESEVKYKEVEIEYGLALVILEGKFSR